MAQVLSFGDRVPTGDFAPHSRFSRAVNFTGEAGLVCLVSPEVGGGPINIVMSGLDLSQVGRLEVRTESFRLDGAAFSKAPLFDSGLPEAPERGGLRACRELLLRRAHPKSLAFLLGESRTRGLAPGFETAVARRLSEAAESLRRGDLQAGARAARGTGLGLTPSGDDLLAGFLWGLHVRQRLSGGDFATDIAEVFDAARGANPLSAAFLRCARDGRFFQRLRDLLAALGDDGSEDLEGRLDAVLAVGETSGADTCVGLMLALEKEGSLWS